MFAWLLASAVAVIRSATWQETQEIVKDHRTYVLAVSSDTFDFSQTLKTFVTAVHQSQIDANFVILDVFKENISESDLNVTTFPAVIYYHRGTPYYSSKGKLETDSILEFLGSHAINEIPHINTEAELQEFIDSAGLAVLCAFANASDETLPLLSEAHQKHFVEINIAYCNPKLFAEEGFYVYRLVDDSLVKVNGTLFGVEVQVLEELLSEYTVPDVFKADTRLASFLEHDKAAFVDIVFDTKDNFYLTPAQLEFARAVKGYCGVNVTYETLDFHYVSKNRYGFPAEVNEEQMRIIDLRGERLVKHMLDGELTLDNAKKMCEGFKQGTLSPWWKSAPVPTNQTEALDDVVALNVGDFVSKGFSAIGFYYSDNQCLRHLVGAKQELEKRAELPIKFAEFSLAENDWPLEDTNFDNLPRLLIFKDGKLLTNEKIADTPDAVIDQILGQVTTQEL